ncbi:MAG: hypothetical protein JWP81_3425 [Ferruginibacter sp.]|nr:hypothetical protein [Ferruginibacter sp.]
MGVPNQSGETFQNIRPRNLVVMVRFKPAGSLDTSAAGGMLSGITNPIDKAVGAIEGAMDNIPGLNMFIKEDKKESESQTKYDFYHKYSNWDKALDKIKDQLEEINPDSKTECFEFSSTDFEGRKKDAQELFSKIKAKIASWSKYTGWIHFVGLGQGGNVANECTSLLAKDSTFKSEKWCVKSIIYVAATQYKNDHLPDTESFKGEGAVFAFGNLYDLTARAVGYFDNNEKLLQQIADANKNTLSLAVGKIKMRLVQIVGIILGGLSISVGPDALKDLDKFDQVKDQIKGMVDDLVGFITKLIDEGTSYVNLNELPEFKKIADGYGDIPGKCIKQLEKFISDLGDEAVKGAKKANLSLGPSDLAKSLNCLCPLFDTIKDSLAVLKPETKTGEELATQIIDKAGITKVFAPVSENTSFLPYDKKYIEKAQEAAKKKEPDMAGGLIAKVHDLLTKATEKTGTIKEMDKEQKIFLAEAISTMSLPLLTSKKEFYAKLLKVIPFNLNEMTKEYTAGKVVGAADDAVSFITFPDELNLSVKNADDEISRVKGYFDQNNFKMVDKIDSLYLIYNSHNMALEAPHGEILKCIDQQTGYMAYKKSKGFDYNNDYKYVLVSKEEKEKAIPTQEVQEKEKV